MGPVVFRSGRMRAINKLAATVVAGPWLALCACGGRPEPPEHPNVLLVTLDTTRADRLGAYGAARARTPAFDRIA